MDCPRCGEQLIHYSLGDSETWNCRNCAYSGITVEHRSDRPETESWAESFERFYEQTAEAEALDRSETPDRCVASTASGQRCSRDAKPGERYCSQHLAMVERDGADTVTDHGR